MISLTKVTLGWTPNKGSQSQTSPRMHLPNWRPRKPDRLSQGAHSQTSYPRVQRENTLDKRSCKTQEGHRLVWSSRELSLLPGKHTDIYWEHCKTNLHCWRLAGRHKAIGYITELGTTVNKELQLEPHPCCDCSTIEGESELSTSRNIGVIQWYLGYCKFILYQPTHLHIYTFCSFTCITEEMQQASHHKGNGIAGWAHCHSNHGSFRAPHKGVYSCSGRRPF